MCFNFKSNDGYDGPDSQGIFHDPLKFSGCLVLVCNNKTHRPYTTLYFSDSKSYGMDHRAIFCEWCESNRIRADDMFSDEACFHLKGYVKQHNTVYWAQDDPHVADDPHHRTNP